MTAAGLMAFAIALFFAGWLINHVRGWGLYVAGAGAVLYLVLWLIGVLHLSI